VATYYAALYAHATGSLDDERISHCAMLNVYAPQDLNTIADRVFQVMTLIDPEWTWAVHSNDGKLEQWPLTVQMIERHLMQQWIVLAAPLRSMEAEEAENYASAWVESGGIACRIEPSTSGHQMAVYVRAGTQ
jgi:hypothetical protein